MVVKGLTAEEILWAMAGINGGRRLELLNKGSNRLCRSLHRANRPEAAVLKDRTSHLAIETSIQAESADLETWEYHIESKIESDPQLSDTERHAHNSSTGSRSIQTTGDGNLKASAGYSHTIQGRHMCNRRHDQSPRVFEADETTIEEMVHSRS